MSDTTNLLDPSKRSEAHLNAVLGADADTPEDIVVVDTKLIEKKVQKIEITPETEMIYPKVETSEVATVKVKDARKEAPILDRTTSRERARLLIFTQDTGLLQEGSVTYRRIADIRASFLEIHIVILNYASGEKGDAIIRPFDNVWMYPTYSSDWWRLSYDAYRVAKAQMVFSGGFRADIIIAEDTCESGMPAGFLSKKYHRPLQLHVTTDFYDETYLSTLPHPLLFSWCTKYVIEHATSVRTKTVLQRHEIIQERQELESTTELFPNYYALDAWKDSVPTASLYEKYPQFKFIILHITTMHTSDHTAEVISGAAKVLKLYPTIGMIIVGSGPLRATYERLILFLGLQNQILFEPTPAEYLSYMKSANVLVHVTEDSTQDEIILMAAMAKIPIVGNKEGIAGVLLDDNHSALLCTPGDIDCVASGVNQYLNENLSRTTFVLRAYESVIDRVEQNYDAYIARYVESIERCVPPESTIDEATPTTP